MSTGGLTARIVGLHRALAGSDLPHAFGGALALAFCTEEPRATKDIDVNVFVGVGRLGAVLAALPPEVRVTGAAHRQLERDGQARLWWDDTPLDVFLSNHPFHGVAEANRRTVPFAGVPDLPVLACADLAVFKAFFARPKDVVDLATMAVAGTIDVDELERTVGRLLADTEDRADLFRRVRSTAAELRGER